jgi:hypothetical protein
MAGSTAGAAEGRDAAKSQQDLAILLAILICAVGGYFSEEFGQSM